jgi:hypothetical protein
MCRGDCVRIKQRTWKVLEAQTRRGDSLVVTKTKSDSHPNTFLSSHFLFLVPSSSSIPPKSTPVSHDVAPTHALLHRHRSLLANILLLYLFPTKNVGSTFVKMLIKKFKMLGNFVNTQKCWITI